MGLIPSGDLSVHCDTSGFPIHCQTFYGPHSDDCIMLLWNGVGCLNMFPLTGRNILDSMNLK